MLRMLFYIYILTPCWAYITLANLHSPKRAAAAAVSGDCLDFSRQKTRAIRRLDKTGVTSLATPS